MQYKTNINISNKKKRRLMLFYDFFLKLYGLKFLFDKKSAENQDIEFNEIVVSIGSNGELEQAIDPKKNNCLNNKMTLKIVGILYFSLIICLLSWQCIYSIVRSIIELNGKYLTASIFSFVYLGQLISGAIFYNRSYFEKTIIKIKEYHTTILIMFIIATTISIILALVAIILLIDGYEIINYTLLYNSATNGQKVILTIILFIESLYAYNIFFVNTIIFSIFLHYQRIGISKYLEKMETLIDGNIQDMTIGSVIDEFAKMQSHYKKSVDNMNNIFTSITVIGIVGSYFVVINIGTSFVTIYSYINFALFLIIEAVYIFSINKINDRKGDIKTLIGSSMFVSKFLNRNDLGPIYGDTYELGKSRKINSTIINGMTDEDLDNDKNKKIDLIKNMTFRSIIISNENGISLDWIVLYNKLSENWQPFKLFGYDFDDTQIVQKLAVVIFGLSAIIRINVKIGV